ncbi:MAG: hypothetical protein RR922_05675 [Clostridia bacterium]
MKKITALEKEIVNQIEELIINKNYALVISKDGNLFTTSIIKNSQIIKAETSENLVTAIESLVNVQPQYIEEYIPVEENTKLKALCKVVRNAKIKITKLDSKDAYIKATVVSKVEDRNIHPTVLADSIFAALTVLEGQYRSADAN